MPGATGAAADQPPDQSVRTRALDPLHSFIVQAPAGSGKTGLLVQRYLALLPAVDVPEEIVAITFTRKAAGEMRERILAALAQAHRGEAADAHGQRTRTLACRALEHDARRGWDVRANPGRLRVLTIDALCASLVRQMPWLSHFGGEPRVADDGRALYRQAARETLGQLEDDSPWGDAVATVLWHLDNDRTRCERMLVDLLARRDQWLRHVAGHFTAGEAQRAHLEAGLGRAVRDALRALRASVPSADAASIVSVAAFAAENLAAEGSPSPIRACRGLDRLPGTDPQDLSAWVGLSELLLTRRGSWRGRHTAEHGLPARRDGEGARMRREARRLCVALAAHDELRMHLADVRDLPATRYSDAQWQVLQALARVLHLAAAMLRVVFTERGHVDHVEVAQAARQALGEEDAPTELALALDHRIRHILVDEFQDTSYSQFELLRRLVAGWCADDGRSLFLVGDPMQSIYRFREADVGLYLRAWERGFGALTLQPLRLQANFRAQGHLVSWVNRVFTDAFPRRAEADTGAVPWQSAVALRASASTPAATVHPLRDADPDLEARLVVRLVQAAMARRVQRRIAVLVRSRVHLGAILPALRAAGIDYRGVELEGLAARPVVQDLLALTRALLHPADRVAWLALLRAPWCGLSLQELHTLTAQDASRAVFELLRDPERVPGLGPGGAARAQRVSGAMQSALARRGSRPLVQAVADVWTALGGPACVETPDLEDATAYFDLLGQLEPEEAVDPQRVSERLETLFAKARTPAAPVEVMTIHKAKGLEFDTVILPGLGRATRVDERRLLTWAERPAGAGPPDLLLAPMAPAGEEPDAISRYLWKLEAKKSEHETTRLLYVAATRAREHLHLIGHATPSSDGTPAPEAGSLLQCIWPAVRAEFERVEGERPPTEKGPRERRTPLALCRLPAGWKPPRPPRLRARFPAIAPAGGETPAAGVAYDWAGRTARCVGTVVHEVLRHIGRDGAAAWDRGRVQRGRRRWRGLLIGLGVPPNELEKASTRVGQALVNVLEDPRGRWILEARHTDAHNEYALTGALGGRVVSAVIDRTFVAEDGVRWIVDYKTGTHEGADIETFLDREQERHRAQLEGYAALMAHRERRPIRLGLYFPLLTGWREWSAPL
ncbi:MAG: UvrD-helicase domain-containing protein [Gammaproteobacteria bacterium]|nr:UvrD-helicase domain-containing protein [Gammaproteobacteria bacterium]